MSEDKSAGRPAGAEVSEAEWRERLSPEEFQVCRLKGTERAFTGEYWNCEEDGIYVCRCCGGELFDAGTKYDSGSGWPSFWQALPKAVGTKEDNSFFTTRTEVHCARCGGHFGHIFSDGPEPTGMRHCINGAALTFRAA